MLELSNCHERVNISVLVRRTVSFIMNNLVAFKLYV